MPCKCGGKDHDRSSSRLCPFKELPRQGKDPPPIPHGESEETGFWKEHQRCVKIGWGGFLRNRALDASIQLAVKQMTSLSFEVSRFLQYHLQRLFEIEANAAQFPGLTYLPDISNDTWMRRLFVSFATANFDDPSLGDSYAKYLAKRTLQVPLPAKDSIPPQMLTIFAQDYVTNISTHIDRLFTIVAKRAYAKYFAVKGVPNRESRRLAATLIAVLIDGNETVLRDEFLTAVQDGELRLLLESHLQAGSSWRTKLHYIHIQNRWLLTQHSRLCVLTPIFSIDSKYVTIDTNVLHSLLGSKKGTGCDSAGFGRRQVCQWALNFRIPPRFVGYEDLGKYFWFQVKTDGVGASFLVSRWLWRPKNVETKSKTDWVLEARVKQQEALSAVRAAIDATGRPPVYIGADPGRKDLVTVVRDMGDGEKPKAVHFSSGRYYHESKFKYRLRKQQRWLKASGLAEWWGATPSLKLGNAESTLDNVAYLFASNDSMTTMFSLRGSRKCRKLRWKAYIHQKKTLAKFAAEILDGLPTDRVTVVAFGDASFNHASPGHAPTPHTRHLRDLLRRNKERLRWPQYRVHVVDIWEFNTSKVCSKCHATRRLRELKGVTQDHFVRRCDEPSCRSIWNRDVNAALNMVYLAKLICRGKDRPPLFSVSLPKTKNHSNSVFRGEADLGPETDRDGGCS